MRKGVKSKYELLKQHAYLIIYGTDTPMGRLFDITLLILISISVIMVMLETVENVDYHLHGILVFLEWVITIFFTLEYILRIISNKKPYQYIFSLYGVIDLIALLPMYLSFVIPGTKALSVVRALRLLRIFRILDLASFLHQGEELKAALRRSRNKIIIFVYFVLVICILLGSLMYLIERHQNGFSSIPRSIYWCIVTLTTVGYGDIAPETALGQIIAAVVMIMGYGIIAVPTGIVTAEYSRGRKDCKTSLNRKENSKATLVCKHCGEHNHSNDAKFCHQCGEPLSYQRTNETI